MNKEPPAHLDALRAFNGLSSNLGDEFSYRHFLILINVAAEHFGGGITVTDLAGRLGLSEESLHGLLRAFSDNGLSPIQQKGSVAGLIEAAESGAGLPDVLVLTVRGGHVMEGFFSCLYSPPESTRKPTAAKTWAEEKPIQAL